MYTIFCDDYLIHSEMDEYRLTNVGLLLEVNNAGSLKFTILPNHPNISALAKLKPAIKVFKNGRVYWKGRIVDDTLAFNNSRNVYCEGKLKVLEDTLVRPGVFDGTNAQVFAAYIDSHNAQVTEAQKLIVGTVNVAGNPYRKLINHETTGSRIKELINSYGGYLRIRYEADGDYIDWLSDFVTVSTQQITLGKNILDLIRDVSAQKTYSACIPLGAKLVDENGSTLEDRLTVESLQGVDYIFDQAKVNEYGWRFAPAAETTWDDITTPAALLSKAQDYLSNSAIKLASSIELTAVDLAFTGDDIDSFNFCEYISVNSTYHGISDEFLLSKLDIDISNPANTKITLGSSVLTLTDQTKKERDNITITINDLITALTGTTNDVNEEVAQRERYIRYANGIIELGESASDLKMRLSNTELSFWESISGVETRVAYISNPTGNPGDSKLYVENGKILKSLGIGDTGALIAESNGSVSIAGIT